MKISRKFLPAIAVSALLSTSALADCCGSCHAKDNKFYVGIHGGFSQPLAKKFDDKETKTEIRIKGSPMIGGMVGYKITDDISLEFVYDHKTKYPAKFVLPAISGGDITPTKANSNSFMLNFVYNMNDVGGFTPYFNIGAGITTVKVKGFTNKMSEKDSKDLSSVILDEISDTTEAQRKEAGLDLYFNTQGADKYTVKSYNSKSFSWQIGLGANKEIAQGLTFGLGAALQVTHDVTLKYRSLNTDIEAYDEDQMSVYLGRSMTHEAIKTSELKYKDGKIKKTIGVAEIVATLKYDLPF
jgi:opacity protein-like surface antigen